jgi:TPP-dependent indolepyruvate ferredoxin oxidoreductase alpha subunit
MTYDVAIPVWGIVLFSIPFLGAGLWVLIKMFFFNKSSQERMDLFENRLEHYDVRHDNFEKDFNEKILKVRGDFEKELENQHTKMEKILEKQIETQTLVKLLVDNKVKGS